MATRNTVIKYSFATGEVMPGIENRRDWDRNDAAIAKGLNGTILPSGGFRKRPGTRFIDECMHHDKPITNVTFRFSQDQIYLLEFGDYRMRVYHDHGQVLDKNDRPYEIETPYSAEQIAEADYAQEKDTIVFAHWDKPVKRLTRYGHADWRWSDLFREEDEGGQRLQSPDSVDWYDDASNGHNGFEYAVTAYKIVAGTPQESINYSTITSDPADISFIPEAPNNNIASCLMWRDKYKERAKDVPTIPDVFDLRGVTHDQMGPHVPDVGGYGYSRLNQRVFNVMKLRYPSAVYAGTRYYSVPLPGGLREWAWTLSDGAYNRLFQQYYLVTTSNNNPADSSLYQEWRPYVAAYNYTSVMIKIATDWINNGIVSAEGKTGPGIYKEIMDFIEDYNERNSQKIHNHIKWPRVAGASGYYVYRRSMEGQDRNFYNVATVTNATDWLDEDVSETPVGERTPITGENSFTDPDNYPSLVTFYQQRLVLGATKSKPTTIFGSRTGIYTDFTINPSDISSGYEFKMASNSSDPLEAIIPLETLVVLTAGGDFISTVAGAMNASNVNFNQKSYNGSSDVLPIIVNDSGLYVPVGQQAIHTMTYAYEKNGFKHDNMLFHAQHLTRQKRVIGLAHQRDPINLVWAVLDDGTFLSSLFIPEQGFVSWTRHETDGLVKSINIVPRNGIDEMWMVVQRTTGSGAVKQYLEVLEDIRPFGNVPEGEKAFFVDSGLSGVFEPEAAIISGLSHLEGLEVAVLADDSVQAGFNFDGSATLKIVKNGSIALDTPARIVHVGLPYKMEMETLRLELVDEPTLRDTRSQIAQCIVDVEDTRELIVSSCGGEPGELIVHEADELGKPKLQTGDYEFSPRAESARKAYMTFSSPNPVPCTINNIVVEIERGDN